MIAPRLLAHAILLAALVALLAACDRRTPLYAAPAAFGGVLVRLHQADFDDDQVRLRLFVTNQSDRAFEIDRDGMALRLADGRVLRRLSPDGSAHEVAYILTPGETRSLEIDFHGEALDALHGSTLVVGGVRVATDTSFRVVGEVSLSTVYTPHATAVTPPAAVPTARQPVLPGETAPVTVAIDLSRLAWVVPEPRRAALECACIAALIQEGFALVVAERRPAVTLDLVGETSHLRIEASGPGGQAQRTIAIGERSDAELQREVILHLSELARLLAEPAE